MDMDVIMKNLKRLVQDLKMIFRPKQAQYGKIYDSLCQMDECDGLRPGGCTDEEWIKLCVQRHGTKEQFIAERQNRKIKEV